MKTATVKLRSVSPLCQSRPYTQEVPKKEGENAEDYEKRTWRSRLHVDEDGYVFVSPMTFKNCLSNAAKYISTQIPGKGKATYTKHFEAGVLVTDPMAVPIKAKEVPGKWLFVPADGVRGSGKRVWKCFPVVDQWEGEVVFHILDDVITEDVFRKTLTAAGNFIGIGALRVRNNGVYGRFEIVSLGWEEA